MKREIGPATIDCKVLTIFCNLTCNRRTKDDDVLFFDESILLNV